MKKYSLAFGFLTTLSVCGCATSTPVQRDALVQLESKYGITEVGYNQLDTALRAGEHEKLRLILEAGGSDLAANTESLLREARQKKDGESFKILAEHSTTETLNQSLWMAFPSDSSNDRDCRDDEARIFFDKKIPVPSDKLYYIKNAAKYVCVETVDLYTKSQPESLTNAIDGIDQAVKKASVKDEATGRWDYHHDFWSVQNHPRLSGFLEMLLERSKAYCATNKTRCHDVQKTNDLITIQTQRAEHIVEEHLAHTNAVAEAQKRGEETAKYQASDDGALEQICRLRNEKTIIQRTIDHQNKIGKVSGVVDQRALYQAGQQMVSTDSYIERLTNEFTKRFKKKPNISKCSK